ncbi:MAG: S-methyl-5-thioribose kinase [Oscillospiraceae bacterium]|nr:S-methyl-5-thioribose kinase [Oscillospiraceae bacterium]
MSEFDSFFLMDTESVKRYAVEVLHLFAPGEETVCEEIGDGNINYVFRIRSLQDGHSAVVKQADRLLRSSGRLLDQNRSRIEAAILKLEGELAPGFVPEVYHYDEVMAATAMEDVSAFGNLRRELAANRVYPHLSENLPVFMVDTLLPTTDLILDAEEKKRRVQFFTNPELCKITEDLVLTEPYYNYKDRNIITPGNECFVEQKLYRDEELHAEAAALRLNFMNNAQALLHGDLHTGSVFANETGIRVLDPEFAFYGPMGYDIGNVIGNLYFSWANKIFAHSDEEEAAAAVRALKTCIAEVYDKTRERLEKRYDEWVTLPLYRIPAFREDWIGSVMTDAAGYAGTEIIRRTVGDSKVMEITSVTDPEQRIPMERALVYFGAELIKNRAGFREGRELTELFERML